MTMTNAVIDLSHYQNVGNFDDVRKDGIIGVFLKASEGTRYVDPTYVDKRAKAQAAGLLTGAYHFGIGGDPHGQAEHFLSLVKPGEELLVLDFEGNPHGSSMTLQEAEIFVHHIYQVTGKYPGLYSGHAIKEAIAQNGIRKPADTELSKCWLWFAAYTSITPMFPKGWGAWTFWQYTDGAAGPLPHDVASIGRCDRDQFNGTPDELRAFWARQLA